MKITLLIPTLLCLSNAPFQQAIAVETNQYVQIEISPNNFSLDSETVDWLREHADKSYLTRLAMLLQKEEWTYEHRRAWRVLKRLDARIALNTLLIFLKKYPEIAKETDFLDLWNLGEDLPPEDLWQIYPRLRVYNIQSQLEERVLDWLKSNPDKAFEFLKLATDESGRRQVLETVFKVLPAKKSVKLFEGFLNGETLEEQQAYLYLSQTLKVEELKFLYKSKLQQDKFFLDVSLEGLSESLGDPEVYPILLGAMSDEDHWLSALNAIRRSKNKLFIPVVRNMLASPDDLKSDMALITLIELGADGLEVPIKQSLSKQDSGAKRQIFFALREYGPERLALDISLPLLREKTSPWHRDAISALNGIQSRANTLEIISYAEKAPYVLDILAKPLLQALVQEDLPNLLNALKKNKPEQQWAFIHAMMVSPEWSVNEFHDYLISIYPLVSEDHQVEILGALGKFASPSRIPFILDQLDSTSQKLKLQVLRALSQMRYHGENNRIKALVQHDDTQLSDLAKSLTQPFDSKFAIQVFDLTQPLKNRCSIEKLIEWTDLTEQLKYEQKTFLNEILFDNPSQYCMTQAIEIYWTKKKLVIPEESLLDWMKKTKDPRLGQYFFSLSLEEFSESVKFNGPAFEFIDRERFQESKHILENALNYVNPPVPEPEIDEWGSTTLPDPSYSLDKIILWGDDFRNLLVVLSKLDKELYLKYVVRLLADQDKAKRQGAAQAIVEVDSIEFIPSLSQAIQRRDQAIIQGLISEMDSFQDEDVKDSKLFRRLVLEMAHANLVKEYPKLLRVIAAIKAYDLLSIIESHRQDFNKQRAELAWESYVRLIKSEALPELKVEYNQKKMEKYQLVELLQWIDDPKARSWLEEILLKSPEKPLIETALVEINKSKVISNALSELFIKQWQSAVIEGDVSYQAVLEDSFVTVGLEPENLIKYISKPLPLQKMELLEIRLYLARGEKDKALNIAKALIENNEAPPLSRYTALNSIWMLLTTHERLTLLERMLDLIQTEFSAYDFQQTQNPYVQTYRKLISTYQEIGDDQTSKKYQYANFIELGKPEVFIPD